MQLTACQKRLLQFVDSLTLSEQAALLQFSPQDFHRLRELIREIVIRRQAERLNIQKPQETNSTAHVVVNPPTPLKKATEKKKAPPLRKCPNCGAKVRADKMEVHRLHVHGRRPKGVVKGGSSKTVRIGQFKRVSKLGSRKSITEASKSVRFVQGGLCNGR